jgi:hypothetical protein
VFHQVLEGIPLFFSAHLVQPAKDSREVLAANCDRHSMRDVGVTMHP